MAKKKRKGISQRIRFEVFKRDSFKCQYCGRSAPEIILEVDHITPVAKDGDETILNFITSCRECNQGKGPRELSDQSAVQKQRAQLEELNERRLQLEMMLEWRKGLLELEQITADVAIREMESAVSRLYGAYLTDQGIHGVRRWVKTYGLQNVLDSIAPAESQLRKKKSDVDDFFNLVGGIARIKKQSEKRPYLRELYYIRGILRKNISYVDEAMAIRLLEQAVLDGPRSKS
jgi:hypothetical protein